MENESVTFHFQAQCVGTNCAFDFVFSAFQWRDIGNVILPTDLNDDDVEGADDEDELS